MKTILYSLIASLLLGGPTVAQVAIGDSKLDVRRLMGQPQGLYSLAWDKTFPFQDESFALQAGRLVDVWEVKGRSNSFQMRATYAFDTTTSRLHPAERLIGVDFIPDKDEMASTMLQQIPVSKAMCRMGCDVFGSRVASFFEVWVCRTPGDTDQRRALGWASVQQGAATPSAAILLCAIVNYGSHPDYQAVRLDLVEWKNMRIDFIRVGAADPRYLGNGSKEGAGWVRMRRWTSEP